MRVNDLAVELNKSSAAYHQDPILEGVHLRKLFPIGSLNLFATKRAVHAVEDTSLALYPGRATALVGESGSGKTTVARILAGLYSPTSGIVRFRGEPAKLRDKSYLQSYRRNVQLVLQDPFSSLNPVHDVRYHLARPLRIFKHAQSRNQETEQILSLLNRVNLSPTEQFIQKYPHQLSGGQRQRVSIARALAVQPEVLLADEPVSMLDVSIRLDILNLLLRLKDEERLALLFITHDIASARSFAEATVVIEGVPHVAAMGNNAKEHTGLWTGGNGSHKREQIQSEYSLTKNGDSKVIINPPDDLTVVKALLFDASTGKCYHP